MVSLSGSGSMLAPDFQVNGIPAVCIVLYCIVSYRIVSYCGGHHDSDHVDVLAMVSHAETIVV